MTIRTCWSLPYFLLMVGCGKAPAEPRPVATNTGAAEGHALNPSLDERIDIHVRLLSNRTIEYEGGVMWTGCRLRSESAMTLVWVGKPATARLLQALREPGRDRAAHVVLTAIWEPQNVSINGDRRSGFIWYRPAITRADLKVAEKYWQQRVAESPVTPIDYRDAEDRWRREITRTVPIMPRARRTPGLASPPAGPAVTDRLRAEPRSGSRAPDG